MERYKEYKESTIPWLKDIPKHWEEVRIKFIANISKGNGITKLDVYEDGDTPCVRYGEIYTKYNNSFDTCFSFTFKEMIQSPRFFEHGDILVSGTGELVEEIGKSIVYVGSNKCLAGGDIIIIKHSQNPIFLNFALNTKYIQEQKSFGKAKLKVVHISSSEIGNLFVAFPPISEQEKIVNYLEEKTSKIDEYLADKEKEIQLLNELKQSIIAKVVTQGLNPNVKMKECKTPFLGIIPEHWEERKMKYCFIERSEKNHPDEPILCATQSQGVIPQTMYQNRVVVVNKGFEGLKFVKEGDFVISLRSFEGGIEYAYYQGIISAAYTILTPKETDYADYYKYLFKCSPFIHVLQTCVTGIREGQNINYQMLSRKFIPLPPLEEQRDIVAYINDKTAKIESLISELQSEIDYLKEYKQRLIADCVTGQINVQNEL